jgi:hypothetical protein
MKGLPNQYPIIHKKRDPNVNPSEAGIDTYNKSFINPSKFKGFSP